MSAGEKRNSHVDAGKKSGPRIVLSAGRCPSRFW
jgi:hypothetical protein